MEKKVVGIIVGSLRRDSYSKKTAAFVGSLLEEQFIVKYPDIGALNMYNQDLEEESIIPAVWVNFRKEIKALDAVLFVTPEYNRSIPPVLKNAIDVASRPMEKNAWSRKPGAIISISQGAIGGFGANHHLRQVATCLNMYLLPQPEAYIGNIASLIGDDGTFEKSTEDFFGKFTRSFGRWIDILAT